MKCPNCSKIISEESQFCRHCGFHIKRGQIFYAGFWIRFGAYFADFIGVIIIVFLIAVVEEILGIPEVISKMGIFGDYIVWIIYSAFFLSIFSSTPGKMLYGLRVTKENSDNLSFGTAVGRAIFQPLSLLFIGAGYWNMGKNEKQQAWHDKQCHTVVVGKKRGNYILQIIISVVGILLYAYLRSLPSTSTP